MKTNFNRYKKKEKSIDEFIMGKDSNIKLLLIFAIKQVTWEEELITKYDVQKKDIKLFIETLKSKGYILFKSFAEVDDTLFQCIINQNSKEFYTKCHTVRVYSLSNEGQQLADDLKEKIIKLSNQRTDLQQILGDIMQRTQKHRELLKKIQEIEYEDLQRLQKYPNGTQIYVETKKSKQLALDTRIATEEIKSLKLNSKQESNPELLSNYESTQLVEYQKKSLSLIVNDQLKEEYLKPKIYDGVHSHLSDKDLNKLVSGELHYNDETGEYLTDKELAQQMKKESVIDAKKKLVKQHNDYVKEEGAGLFICKGYHEAEEIKENSINNKKDEGLDFLDSLR